MSVERPPSLTGRRLFLLSPLALALVAARTTPAERGRESTGAPPPSPTLQPIPYLTSDSGIGGPNAFSMVDGLHLPWPSRTPWLDANGVAGGLKPFAAHSFSLHERYTFPVTALVRKFVSGQNRGFCLRPVGDFAMNFGGRLADDVSTRPVLTIKTSKGVRVATCDYFARYYPNPDQGLATADCRKVVGLPSIALAIGHFDLRSIDDVIIEASLALTCIAIDAASTALIELYELDAPRIFEGNGGESPVLGIADRYPLDEGLKADPAVLFVGNFKNANDTGWHYGMYGQQSKIGYDQEARSYFYEGGIETGGNFAQDVQVWLDGIVIDGSHGGRPKLQAWRELYMRMYIRLNADFFSSQVTSWKMPGIGLAHGIWSPMVGDPRFSLGGYWDSGSTSGRGAITEGFGTIHQDKRGRWVYDEGSMRGAIGKPVDSRAPDHPYKGLMPLGNSPYHHEMTAYDGGELSWPGVTLQRERWYCIEQHVRMNTINTQKFSPIDQFGNYSWDAANADGRMRAWVDGRLVVDRGGFRFARNPAIGLRGLDGNWYFGGQALSTSRQSYRWRDVVIATSYVGPRRVAQANRPSAALPAWTPLPNELKIVPTRNNFESQNPKVGKYPSEFHRIVDDFSGGVYNPHWGVLGCMVFHGGGHAATDDNSVVILDYNDLTFKRLSQPSLNATVVDKVSGEYPDGKPGAPHTYDCMVIAPPENGAPAGALITPMRMAIGYRGGVDTDFAHKMAFSPGQENDHSALWTRIGVSTLLPMAPGGASAYDSKRKGIWYTNAASPPYIRFLDISSQSKTQIEIKSVAAESGPDSLTMRYDSRRDIIIMSAVREDGLTYLMWLDCASPKTGWRIAKTSMPLPAPRYPAAMPFDIVPEIDKYCLLASADKAAVFEFELPKDLAMPWQVNRRTFTGLPSIPFAYVSGKRWSYVPAAKSFLWLAAAKGPLYAYRPAGT